MRNTIGFALCLLAALLIAGFAGTDAAASLSNSGGGTWKYQRDISIKENSGTSLTDYQVQIELKGSDYPSEAQRNGADVRFTDADGSELSYWIESWDADGRSAKVWVKVPKLAAGATAVVRMYYGNPSASAVSNGDKTFEFFDDFSTNPNTNGKWAIYKYSGDSANEASWDSTNGIWYLTRAVGHKGVAVFANYDLIKTSWKVDFNYLAGGGSGADGFVFMFYKNKGVYGIPGGGGDLGFTLRDKPSKSEVAGYGIEFDNYRNDGGDGTPIDPNSANHIAIIKDDISTHLTYTNDVRTEDNAWHNVEITFIDGRTIIKVDSNAVINYIISSPGYAYSGMGFGAGTGDLTNNHVIDNFRVRKFASSEPTITLAPPKSSSLSITKSASPYSIRQFQETNIKISIENSGTTDIKAIEVTDSLHPSFSLTGGEFPNPKKYDIIRQGEARELQYTIKAKESGTFTLEPAAATYADKDGNIQEASSEPVSIKVIPSPEGTPERPAPSELESSAVLLHGEKTDVVLGEDILLKLSAVNLINKPPMTVQVILYPPSGMSVTSSEFVKSGAGIFTTTYSLAPGDGKDIEVRIKSNQVGDFGVRGRIVYYFGEDKEKAEDHTLTLPIKVRKEAGQTVSSPTVTDDVGTDHKTPGFAGVQAIIWMLLVALFIKRRGMK